MKPILAMLVLATALPAAAAPGSVTQQAARAADALELRLNSISNITVEYVESGHTRRHQQETSAPIRHHLLATRDLLTSSGWSIVVSEDAAGLSAMHDVYSGGTGMLQSLRPGPDGWANHGTACPLDSATFLDQCVSFFHHVGIPRETSGPAVMLPVRIDGRVETLPFVSVRAGNTSATVCLSEPGLLGYRAGNKAHTVEEHAGEFRRVPPLGLVPVRKRIHSMTAGVAESDTVLEVRMLRVNDGGAAAAADTPTTGTFLARYAGKAR